MKIKGKEFSEETIALALEAYVLEHPEPKLEPPKLEHGDYGYDEDGDSCMALKSHNGSGIPGPFRRAGPRYAYECNFDDSEPSWKVKTKLGNIFKDLERNKVDLERFKKSTRGSGILRMTIYKWCDCKGELGIEFLIDDSHTATTDLEEATEIHQKLGQMIATAKRKSK